VKTLDKVLVASVAALAAAVLAKRWRRSATPISRLERLRRAYAEAANDGAYQAEMAEIDRAFDVTVGDGLERAAKASA
jgi:HAMP domain-containing protein